MANRDKPLQAISSDEELEHKDQDADYFPEHQRNSRSLLHRGQDSERKLQHLMDCIDSLTHSLNNYSQSKSSDPSSLCRRHGPENQDQKDLISEDKTLYTVKLTQQPSNIMGGLLRDYQLEGLNWLVKMHACKINGVLADQMGLGKTLQTISLLAHLRLEAEGPPHIVIVPKSTIANWKKEFFHWSPSLDVFEFYGNLAQRELLRPKAARTNTYHILLTTYEIAMAQQNVLKTVRWDYLVIDEAHRIKNEKSVLSKVVRLFHTRHRLLITGTPLQNNLHQLWSLLNFLMPKIFTSAQDFDDWFNLQQSSQDKQEFLVLQLHKILKPFMLRRLKKEVETKLPPKRELYVFLGMTDQQRELYKGILTKNIDVINGFGERAQLMNTIMQLRKVCNHPYLFDKIEPGPPYFDGQHLVQASMKFVFLDKLLPRLIQKGSKVLIFSQMTRLLDILYDFLTYRGYSFCRIDGSTHYIQREEQIEAFQNPNSEQKIFILSTRAGGLGINLHAANTVIIYDSDWNPQVDIQAMDRAHRIGQTRTVTIYRFVTTGTVQQKIAERAAKKLKMDHLVIQRGGLATNNKAPSAQEMNQIVQFGAQQVLKSTGKNIPQSDIDLILEYAQEKTEQLNDELSKLEQAFNLQNFSLDGQSLYEFEGNDYKNVQKQYVSLGSRSRKSTGFYDAERMAQNAQKKNKKKGWRFLVGGGNPHQFFQTQLLDRLDAKEDTWNEYMNEKPKRKTRGAPKQRPEAFTDKDKHLRKQLLNEGFSNWNKKEFNLFIKGCQINGRNEFGEIAEEIGTKSEKEVRKYSKVFWKKYQLLPNGAELVKRIQQGEQDIQRLNHIELVLKRERNRNLDNLLIEEGEKSGYSREEDEFLLKNLFQHGYGYWDDLRFSIKEEPKFRFNFWFQSKSAEDLQDRCDFLISILEEDSPKKMRKVEQKLPLVEISPDLDWIIKLPKIQLV